MPVGRVTSDSEHYVWLRNGGANGWCYRLILYIMYGSQMEVPLSNNNNIYLTAIGL